MGPEEKNNLLKQCLDEFYDQILNFMYFRVYNRFDAEDLTQEAFLAITRSIEQYQYQASLRTWVFAIARNILNDEYRKKNKLHRLLVRLQGHLRFKPADQDEQTNLEIFMLLETLPEADQELIILKHYFGFTYEEIADITKLSVSNVGARLSRAIAKLKEMNVEGSDTFGQEQKPL